MDNDPTILTAGKRDSVLVLYAGVKLFFLRNFFRSRPHYLVGGKEKKLTRNFMFPEKKNQFNSIQFNELRLLPVAAKSDHYLNNVITYYVHV